ncbi:MAG: efflux RND transporter periplasmic adaptor subunit [Ichthyobacteriaceae bacterium]|nr:efflux RND transporter periplasmic adaptor subunit [Ichthyobacteriaceae bacterium]
MKNILKISILLLILVVTSCKSDAVDDQTISGLKAKRTEIKTEIDKLNAKLKIVDKDIAALSTDENLYLVSVVNAEKTNFKHYIEVQGNVNSDQSISMFPEMGGLVKSVFVKEGVNVKKGQTLMLFDSSVLQRNLQELQSSLELATTIFERQEKLWNQKIGSEMQYLQAKNNVSTLKSKKDALKAQILKSKIIAPFSGIIDRIFVKKGEVAAPQMPALRLINLDKIYIESDVSEKYISQIKKGTEAVVTFPNSNITMQTKVWMTGNFIKLANRTFRIVVNVSNKDHSIKPNQLAVVKLLDNEEEGVVIPTNLILNNPDGTTYVYTVLTKKGVSVVKKVNIVVGKSYKNKTLIKNGLSENAIVVDKGARSIQEGQKVKVGA